MSADVYAWRCFSCWLPLDLKVGIYCDRCRWLDAETQRVLRFATPAEAPLVARWRDRHARAVRLTDRALIRAQALPFKHRRHHLARRIAEYRHEEVRALSAELYRMARAIAAGRGKLRRLSHQQLKGADAA